MLDLSHFLTEITSSWSHYHLNCGEENCDKTEKFCHLLSHSVNQDEVAEDTPATFGDVCHHSSHEPWNYAEKSYRIDQQSFALPQTPLPKQQPHQVHQSQWHLHQSWWSNLVGNPDWKLLRNDFEKAPIFSQKTRGDQWAHTCGWNYSPTLGIFHFPKSQQWGQRIGIMGDFPRNHPYQSTNGSHLWSPMEVSLLLRLYFCGQRAKWWDHSLL